MKMKKGICMLLATIMLLTFVPGAMGAESDVQSALNAGKVVIPFWFNSADEPATQNWWDSKVAAFNAQSETTFVDMQAVPDEAYDAKLKSAQSTGTAPQVLYLAYTDLLSQASMGYYMPLDDLIDPALWEDVYESAEKMVMLGDTHYGIPHHLEPYSLLFYRKDMFREAGLDPEVGPKSWDELVAYAKALTTPEHYGLAIAGESDMGWVNWGFEAMFGKNLLNDDWSAPNVHEPEFAQLISLYKTLYDEQVVPAQALGAFWNIQPLAEGRVAMQFNGTWAISNLKNAWADTVDLDDIGICVAPTPDGVVEGVCTAAMGGHCLAIDANAKNPENCAEFLTWLLLGDSSIMAEFFDAGAFSKYTARKSVDAYIMTMESAKNDPWLKVIIEQVTPYAVPEPIYPWDVTAAYAAAISNVLINDYSIEQALALCEEDIRYVIESNDLAGNNPRSAD